LESRGYRQDEQQPFRFFKAVTLGEGLPVDVEVDLLAGEYGGTGRGHRTQPVQDVRARKARGADLVFEHCMQVRVSGRLPNGALDTVTIKVADIVAFLAMKGMALHDRRNEKDCYDIYYCVANYPGGIDALAEAFRPFVGNRLVAEGLSKIRAKFLSPGHFGPVAVAEFHESSDADERAVVTRDAYERLNALLDRLDVKPGSIPRHDKVRLGSRRSRQLPLRAGYPTGVRTVVVEAEVHQQSRPFEMQLIAIQRTH
jgi:hypothetical protein